MMGNHETLCGTVCHETACESANHETVRRQRYQNTYIMALISANASSTMNALGSHSGIFETSFCLIAVSQGVMSFSFADCAIMKATGTPFRHLSNTIRVYRGYCKSETDVNVSEKEMSTEQDEVKMYGPHLPMICS